VVVVCAGLSVVGGIVSTWPTYTRFWFVMSLAAASASTVTP
jgi:hypothetical protein